MHFPHPSDLLLAPPASSAGLRWPAWCMRIALGWTNRCIERLQTQLADDFAIDALAPLYRELEAMHLERDGLLTRLAIHSRS